MKLRTIHITCVFVALGLLLGCDTQSTVSNPNKSFFVKYYGTDGDQTGEDMLQLPDGSIMLFGTTRASGTSSTSQWYLVKVDVLGNVIWEKQYGGIYNDEARDIELTPTNQIVLAGNTFVSPIDRDARIMLVSLDGDSLASNTMGYTGGGGAKTDEEVVSVSAISDGFIITGSTTFVATRCQTPLIPNSCVFPVDIRDALQIRFNSDLSVYPSSWTQVVGAGSYDVLVRAVQLSATEFDFFGYTNRPFGSNQDFNYWYFRVGANGDAIGNNIEYPGKSTTDNQILSSVCIAPASSFGGYFLGGITRNANGTTDFYVTKLLGPLVYSGSDYQFDKPLSMRLGTNVPESTACFPLSSGGFLLLGNENGFNNDQNWVLTKLGTDGLFLWSLPIVFGGEGLDTCAGVQELPNGRILVFGTMRTGRPDAGEFKMTLIKVSANGKFE